MNWQQVVTAMARRTCCCWASCCCSDAEIAAGKGRDGFGIAFVAVAGAVVAAWGLYSSGYTAAPFAGHFSITPVGALAKLVVLALTLPVLLISRDDFADTRYYVLLLASLYGACLLVSSDSMPTLFLALEIMSLPVYALVLLANLRPESAEAALKYLVLGGTATATFLMGVALLYGATGSMATTTFAQALGSVDPLAIGGVVLIVAALFLKAAVVPFHAWAPDAYEGASVPVTAYMATVIKAGVLFAALRLFGTAPVVAPFVTLLAVLPLVSMVWGNVAAIRQTSFRRMIAYSSIATRAYLFYALLGAGEGRHRGDRLLYRRVRPHERAGARRAATRTRRRAQ
jgi:NADH-quinone oxidoreductase subunit N